MSHVQPPTGQTETTKNPPTEQASSDTVSRYAYYAPLTKSRCHKVNVTAHEKMLLAYYRSSSERHQAIISGLLLQSSEMRVTDYQREERTLGLGHLSIEHLIPFIRAKRRVAWREGEDQQLGPVAWKDDAR